MSNTSTIKQYTIIDQESTSRQKLYELLDSYFDSPSLEKIKDDGKVSIYMCRIVTLLASPEQRYLIAITPHDDEKVGEIKSLYTLKWKSLQMRLLSNVDPKVCKHSYRPKNTKSFYFPIRVIERYPDRTEYYIDEQSVKDECIVSILHTTPDQRLQCPDKSSFPSAIESYRTLFLIKE